MVVAAGIRPNTDVALTSGFTVERAIVVDDHMRTVEDDDVFAVGECVQHRGEVYGLVAPLWEQATVLADQLTGTDPRAQYLGSRTATKLKVAGVDVASMGITEPERDTDEHITFSEPKRGVYKSVIIRDEKIIGATLLGDSKKVAFLQQAFDRGLPLPQERVELLFDIGGPPAEVGAAEMADDAQVCNCNGVSKGTIVDAVAAGCKSVGSVMDKTRAGKGCGSCKLLVGQIVEVAADGAVEEDPSVHYYVPGIPMDKPALMAAIRAAGPEVPVRGLRRPGPGRGRGRQVQDGARLAAEDDVGRGLVDEKDARFINDRVHANIQKDGTFSVVPQMRGGITTPEQLRRIADVADKYQVPMVKLTGGQRIDLLGIKKEDLPGVWADLDMPSGYAYGKSMRTVKTCVGQDFCRFGTGDSTTLGVEIETLMQGMESPAKMKLSVSGCPRNCAESYVKDVGIVAIEGGRWEIYIGGAAGAHIRKGDLLCTVDDPETAKQLTARFLQYYRENAKWLERTYASCRGSAWTTSAPWWSRTPKGSRTGSTPPWPSTPSGTSTRGPRARNPVTPGQFRTSLAAGAPAPGPGRSRPRNCWEASGDRSRHRLPRAGCARPDPARGGPHLHRRRRADRRLPPQGRHRTGPRCGLPPPGRAAGRRPDRRPGGHLPAPSARFRPQHRAPASPAHRMLAATPWWSTTTTRPAHRPEPVEGPVQSAP